MPFYPSAQALLDDARLRIDAFGQDKAVLVVEGPDDKRLMSRLTLHRQQVIASGGRRLLLSAHRVATESSDQNIAFVTDCDYEVALGALRPGSPSLCITTNADVEADLIAIGGLENVIAELVPGSDATDDSLRNTAMTVLKRAVALAEPLGSARKIAKTAAFSIDTDLRLHKYRRAGTTDVNETKIAEVLAHTSPDCQLSQREFAQLVSDDPGGYEVCNGHDLARAVERVLRDDFAVRGQTASSIETLLRVGMSPKQLESWDVVTRLKRWQAASEVQLFESV